MNQVDHAYFQERLSAYADNELPPAERALLEAHLQECADCRERLARLRSLGTFVTEQSELDDSDYWEQAARKIEAALPETSEVIDLNRERKRHSVLWWRLPAIAASVLILGYIGLHESDILNDKILQAPESEPSLQKAQPELPNELQTDSAVRREARDGGAAVEQTLKDKSAGGETAPETTDAHPASDDKLIETSETAESGITARTPAPSLKTATPATPDTAPAYKVETAEELGVPEPAGLTETKSPPPAAVTPTELPEPKVADEADESNHVQPKPMRSAPAVAAAAHDADTVLDRELLRASDEVASQTAALTLLRVRRDSLELALSKLKKAAEGAESAGTRKGRDASSFTGGSGGGENLGSLLTEWTRKEKKASAEQAEAALTETWFQICRQSSDPDEVERGVDYLWSVAREGADGNRDSAKRYLKQLGKQ